MNDVIDENTGTVYAYTQAESRNGTLATDKGKAFVIGGLVSTNGGGTYQKVSTGIPAPGTFVPSYIANRTKESYDAVANIVQFPGDTNFWYTIVKHGYLWRTNNIADNSAWRGWNGSDFVVPSGDWVNDPDNTQNRNLTKVLNDFVRIVWSTVCECWIGISWSNNFAYQTSTDLVRWSRFKELYLQSASRFWPSHATGANYAQTSSVYPAIYDLEFDGPGAEGVSNFVKAGPNPYLYFMSFGFQGHERVLVRLPLQISLT